MRAASDLIFDVGMHMAQDTSFYLTKDFRVVAVEANSELCRQARDRFAREIDDGRLTIVEAAVAPQTGPVTFYANERTEWGTTDPEWAQRNARQLRAQVVDTYTVKGVTFRSLLEEYGVPHYLKIDIEGADLLCLEALRDSPITPTFVSIESNKRSWQQLTHEFDLLEELGYRRFKVVNQSKVPGQSPPFPSREGRYVEASFSRGASGLFGAELPGPWRTRRQALRRYAVIFLRYRLYGDYGIIRPVTRTRRVLSSLLWRTMGEPGWFDTHATR